MEVEWSDHTPTALAPVKEAQLLIG